MEDAPLLRVTDEAHAKIQAAAKSAGRPDAHLRIGIASRRGAGFTYELTLAMPDELEPDDVAVETPGGMVYVAAADVEQLRGAIIGLNQNAPGGAIAIDNPNSGWTDPLAQRVQDVIDTQVNPGIASHGGYIDLLEVREGTAYISMGGGCVGCAQVDVTLRQGVEVSIKRSVPEIVAIVDTTDHASGTNPYYQSAKK